jgi:hypothetical protein
MKLVKYKSVRLVHDNGDSLTPSQQQYIHQIMRALQTSNIIGRYTQMSDLVALRIINVLSRKGYLGMRLLTKGDPARRWSDDDVITPEALRYLRDNKGYNI